MRQVLLVGTVVALVLVALFLVNSFIVNSDAFSYESDGWCELRPGGVPNVDDPDCEGWDY